MIEKLNLLLKEEAFDEVITQCKELLKEDANNASYWYYLFLAENKNYIYTDFNNIKDEMAFNQALELSNRREKAIYLAEYNLYKNFSDIPYMRELFRYAQLEDINKVIEYIEKVNDEKISFNLSDEEEFFSNLDYICAITASSLVLDLNLILINLLYLKTNDERLINILNNLKALSVKMHSTLCPYTEEDSILLLKNKLADLKITVETQENKENENTFINTLMIKAKQNLKEGNYKRADVLLDEIIDEKIDYAEAYLYKLLIKLKLTCEEELLDYDKDIENNENYLKALQYASNTFKAKLVSYSEKIKRNIKENEINVSRTSSNEIKTILMVEYVKNKSFVFFDSFIKILISIFLMFIGNSFESISPAAKFIIGASIIVIGLMFYFANKNSKKQIRRDNILIYVGFLISLYAFINQDFVYGVLTTGIILFISTIITLISQVKYINKINGETYEPFFKIGLSLLLFLIIIIDELNGNKNSIYFGYIILIIGLIYQILNLFKSDKLCKDNSLILLGLIGISYNPLINDTDMEFLFELSISIFSIVYVIFSIIQIRKNRKNKNEISLDIENNKNLVVTKKSQNNDSFKSKNSFSKFILNEAIIKVVIAGLLLFTFQFASENTAYLTLIAFVAFVIGNVFLLLNTFKEKYNGRDNILIIISIIMILVDILTEGFVRLLGIIFIILSLLISSIPTLIMQNKLYNGEELKINVRHKSIENPIKIFFGFLQLTLAFLGVYDTSIYFILSLFQIIFGLYYLLVGYRNCAKIKHNNSLLFNGLLILSMLQELTAEYMVTEYDSYYYLFSTTRMFLIIGGLLVLFSGIYHYISNYLNTLTKEKINEPALTDYKRNKKLVIFETLLKIIVILYGICELVTFIIHDDDLYDLLYSESLLSLIISLIVFIYGIIIYKKQKKSGNLKKLDLTLFGFILIFISIGELENFNNGLYFTAAIYFIIPTITTLISQTKKTKKVKNETFEPIYKIICGLITILICNYTSIQIENIILCFSIILSVIGLYYLIANIFKSSHFAKDNYLFYLALLNLLLWIYASNGYFEEHPLTNIKIYSEFLMSIFGVIVAISGYLQLKYNKKIKYQLSLKSEDKIIEKQEISLKKETIAFVVTLIVLIVTSSFDYFGFSQRKPSTETISTYPSSTQISNTTIEISTYPSSTQISNTSISIFSNEIIQAPFYFDFFGSDSVSLDINGEIVLGNTFIFDNNYPIKASFSGEIAQVINYGDFYEVFILSPDGLIARYYGVYDFYYSLGDFVYQGADIGTCGSIEITYADDGLVEYFDYAFFFACINKDSGEYYFFDDINGRTIQDVLNLYY